MKGFLRHRSLDYVSGSSKTVLTLTILMMLMTHNTHVFLSLNDSLATISNFQQCVEGI